MLEALDQLLRDNPVGLLFVILAAGYLIGKTRVIFLGSAAYHNPRRRSFWCVSAWRGAFRYMLQRESLDSPPRHTAGNSAPERLSVGDSCFHRAAVAA